MVDQQKITAIVAAGYSMEQAKLALDENGGDVDDAIDSLFLKGRESLRNVASNPPFDDEDVTVTDGSVAPTAADAVASSGCTAIVAGRFSHTRRSADATSSHATPSLGIAVLEESSRVHSVRGNGSAAARHSSRGSRASRALNDVDPESGLICSPRAPPRGNSKEKGLSAKENMDTNSVGAYTTSKSVAGASSRSSARQGGSSFPEPIDDRLPGAFAIGSSSAMARNDNGDLTTGSIQPSLQQVTTAELVDPDQDKQILEKRLQEELERERENAAVAEVVNESELKTCHWRRVLCVVGVVLVALAIALAVSLTRPPKSSSTETAAPTVAPTSSPLPQELIDLIAPVSFDGGESLMDPFSPQSAAARWLVEDANLASYSDQRKLQRYALATFYFSTNGKEWKDSQQWLSDSNECTDWWVREFDGDEDVKLDCDANKAISILYIQDNNLAGSLPDEIAFLSNSMFDLRLNDNQIGGKLPSAFGLMTRLKALYLEGNNVTGPIPTEFGLMSTLDELKLGENMLIGSIPTEMALMTSLDDLRLHKNNLVGTISPTLMGSLLRLDTLRLSENNFSSTIPTEIGLLSLLNELKLHRNKLVGPLPSEMGRLNVMTDFACHENELTGTLPTELGLLTALKDELRIVSNNFTGPIPTEFASFTNLGRLRMGENQLTGTILSTLGLLHPTLNRLELQSNLLTGSIPEELGLLTLLSDLRLHANNLTGTILSEFTQFTELKGLNLHNNSFTGTIPPFGNLTRLKDFRAGFNMLTGTIPSSIDRLVSLEELKLSNNALTGTIPKVIFNRTVFPNLLKVYLFNNSFTGNATCPPHIVDCYLSCEGNGTCRTLS